MPSEIEKCIGLIEDKTDPEKAYFSFTTDDSGENGVIKANKEGLRLYALELLKKAQELEENPAQKDVMFFDEHTWLEDDASVNIIWGVQPVAERVKSTSTPNKNTGTDEGPLQSRYRAINGWVSYPALISGMLIAGFAAFKWFY